MNSSAIFESFNAKNLRPEQVAKTFITSINFKKIAKRRHSVIIGPRGSGKTSMLKMLQVEALDSWNNEESHEYKRDIDFHGAFIATDRVFKEQVESLQFDNFSDDVKELFAISIFTTHVFKSLAQAFQFTTKNNTENDTYDFIEAISLIWSLNLKSYSFSSLMTALHVRKSLIPALANKLRFFDSADISKIIIKDENSFLHLDMIQAVSAAVDLYEQFFPNGLTNWALLFDELELAPKCVVQRLIDALRGTNDKIILKLSVAPYSPEISIVKDIFSAAVGQDYDQVVLWNSKKLESNRQFTIDLVKSMLAERGIALEELDFIFKNPVLKLRNALFSELFRQDPSFRVYIRQKNIDIDNLESITGNDRRELLGKIAHIVRIRLAAMNFNGGSTSKISLRKLHDYYAGKDMLFDLLEGNPRLIIGVLSPLLDEYQSTGKRVSVQRQLDEVNVAINKFMLFLKSIPIYQEGTKFRGIGVNTIINEIGDKFATEVLSTEFNENPVGSFTVDKNIPPALKSILGAALNSGALVHLHGLDSDVFLGDLEGHKFRLSFLLVPKFNLPVNVMASSNLSSLIKGNDNKGGKNFEFKFSDV